MRIDKFLNAVNLTKLRAETQDVIDENVIHINEKAIKASQKLSKIITVSSKL